MPGCAAADSLSVLGRLRQEQGFTLVELIAAMAVLSIALLALMASYDQTFFSSRSSGKTSSATLLANNQLELYEAYSYWTSFTSIGLDQSTLATVKATDSVYTADAASLPGSAAGDVTISGCGATANCLPVQTATGSDHRLYKVETFIRDVSNGQTSERVVTVIVRDASASGSPEVVTLSTAFDETKGRS